MKKRLPLDELKIKSFITNLDEQQQQVHGGGYTEGYWCTIILSPLNTSLADESAGDTTTPPLIEP